MSKTIQKQISTLDEFVKQYFDDIAKNRWKPDYKAQRMDDYLKWLSDYYKKVEIPLKDDWDYFEEMLKEIKERGYVRSGIHYEYSENVIRRLRYFTWRTFVAGAELGLFKNILEGTGFYSRKPRSDIGLRHKSAQELRKSLTAREEYQLYDQVSTAYDEIGELMGVLLQWILGTRNNETSAITYRDIKPLEGYPDWYIVIIHATVYRDKRERKAGGKTSNFYREIPIPEHMYRIIRRRRERIEALIASGEITFPHGKMKSIDDLPVANHGNKWFEFCLPHEINDAVKQVFQNIHIDKAFLRSMHDEMQRISEEDSLTAYVLRRNYVTHITILGLGHIYRRYLTGHDLNDKTLHRSIYNNPAELEKMCFALARRPLVNDIDYNAIHIPVEKDASIIDLNDMVADIKLKAGQIRLRVAPNESFDVVEITFDPVEIDGKMMRIDGTYRQCKSERPQKEEVNVLKYYYDEYREAKVWWEKEKKKREKAEEK